MFIIPQCPKVMMLLALAMATFWWWFMDEMNSCHQDLSNDQELTTWRQLVGMLFSFSNFITSSYDTSRYLKKSYFGSVWVSYVSWHRSSDQHGRKPYLGEVRQKGVSWNRGTTSYHPLLDGIVPNKNHPAIGVPPWLWKPPYCYHILIPLWWLLWWGSHVVQYYKFW